MKYISPYITKRLGEEVERFQRLESELANPAVGSDLKRLEQLSRQHAKLRPRVEKIKNYFKLEKQWQQASQLAKDNNEEEDLRLLAQQEAEELEKLLKKEKSEIEFLILTPDPHEGASLIMEIRAATGGEESALFASQIARMYLRLSEKHSLQAEMISSSISELGGYRELILAFRGEKAYALLHQEGGTHRVQRIPITESGGRIHTSTVTITVLPEVEESEIEIDEKELQIDVFRASGAGGQHVNKTESAIRITHIPSGIVTICQDERSQHKNRARAMRILRARLAEKMERERRLTESNLKKEQVKSGERSERIRTYNFPQGRITDHRIGYTAYNLPTFLEGEVDELFQVLIAKEREQKLKEALAETTKN